MKLSTKIGLALFLVLASALSMTTVLNYLRFDQTLKTLQAQRMTVILSETSQDILAGIDLGLKLENLENLQSILKRRLGMSDDVRNVAVLDCDRTPISSVARSPNDPVGNGGATSPQSPDQWINFVPGNVTAGRVLRDSLGQCAGQVVITASTAASDAKRAHAFSEMWKSAVIGMTVIFPVLGLLHVLMRRRHHVFEELNEDVTDAVAGKFSSIRLHDKYLLTKSEIELVALYREIRDQLPHDTQQDDRPHQFATPAEVEK